LDQLGFIFALGATLSKVVRPKRGKVDDILDDHRVSLVVIKGDEFLFVLINKVGTPRGALFTLVTNPRSYAFQTCGLGMV